MYVCKCARVNVKVCVSVSVRDLPGLDYGDKSLNMVVSTPLVCEHDLHQHLALYLIVFGGRCEREPSV